MAAAYPLRQPRRGCHLPVNGEDFCTAAGRLAGQAGVMFGWGPDAFWRATPAELAALALALRGDAPPTAPVDLAALMERFPDER